VIKKLHFKEQLILASASPRRKKLLSDAGYNLKVVPSEIDESNYQSEGIVPREYAEQLASAKAENVAKKFPDCLVLGADTIIDFDGQIIGKPSNAKNAEEITKKLFGKPHKVITAITLIKLINNIKIIKSDTTIVYSKKMTDRQIAAHIKSGRWQDKAGAYAIQENADEFVEKIQGSLTNVMGLPMELLKKMLAEITD